MKPEALTVHQLMRWCSESGTCITIRGDGLHWVERGALRPVPTSLSQLAHVIGLGEEVAQRASALDTQVGGGHYKGMAIQPMEYSMANKLDACQHTAIKYVSRFREKGGVQDLHKAIHVLQMLIEFETRTAANDNTEPAKAHA